MKWNIEAIREQLHRMKTKNRQLVVIAYYQLPMHTLNYLDNYSTVT